jgi:hypothetical protein
MKGSHTQASSTVSKLLQLGHGGGDDDDRDAEDDVDDDVGR